MGAVDEFAIAKAEARAARLDLRELVETTPADRPPAELASSDAKLARRRFLCNSLGDPGLAERTFERILLGNELQPIGYLQRGAIAARAVARIMSPSSAGTGFLISPRVLITNNHVLPDRDYARRSRADFAFELDLGDRLTPPTSFAIRVDDLFHTSVDLDFTVVALDAHSIDGAVPLASFGCLPLLDVPGKAFEGEWLTIVQHPNGEPKQVCVRENRLIKRDDDVLWYSTDTLAGSSGAAVFNNDWFVVALHHSGVTETRNGRRQTIDGRDFDPDTMDESRIKWVANEGIRASRIAQTLKAALPDHPLLTPMYRATPSSARITDWPAKAPAPSPTIPQPEPPDMTDNPSPALPLELRLRIEANGEARLVSAGGAAESATFAGDLERRPKPRTANFSAPFDDDYSTRRGYAPGFLKQAVVGLPKLGKSLQLAAAPLLDPQEDNTYVLHYHNYSVVMHAERRLAIYSAANIDFAGRYDMSRPEDVWRRDPRIKAEHQLENWYYAKNNFDRGHLTRREDLEYGGTPRVALASAADTCHWTNCTPQHARFNQSKEIWQGIERYILESTILERDDLLAQVITGPVLDQGDPEYKGVRYPLQFWKVVAAVDDKGQLFATAYIASQEEVIVQFGVEAAPFGAFKTFQTTVAEIERLTGLTFVCGEKGEDRLKDHDPMSVAPRRRRRPAGVQEAMAVAAAVGYQPIDELEDIQL